MEEKCEGNDDAFNNNWIKPKKCVSTMNFFKKIKNKEECDDEINKSNVEKDTNNNQHKALLSDDEKEDENECCTMECEEGSSVVTANEEVHEQQVMKSNDMESECETSNKEKENEEDIEKESAIEALHETLVSELNKGNV